jgi:CRISPR-associated endoribonuclease Cas6
MRIILNLTPSKQEVPFSHLPVLAGTLHRWLGPNSEHDGLSLYSFSWWQGGVATRSGLTFPKGARWSVSALAGDFLQRSISGIMSDADIRWGMRVQDVFLMPPPVFNDGGEERLLVSSPVLVKRKDEHNREHHYRYSEPESDALLTETMRTKLRAAGLDATGVSLRFDRNYPKAKTQLVTYRNIENRCNYCPVLITGTAEQKAFAWTVGLGNSTGIGFGGVV